MTQDEKYMKAAIREAKKAYDKLYDGDTKNPFVILKCPWCGAQMGVVRTGKTFATPGYKKVPNGRKEKLILQCANKEHECEFSKIGFELPLQIVDDEIYSNPPTLLLGTVDKFAMLPYRPEAQTIFGIKNIITPAIILIINFFNLLSFSLFFITKPNKSNVPNIIIINGMKHLKTNNTIPNNS